MSTRKQLDANPEGGHPHLRLISSTDEAIANAKAKAADPGPSSLVEHGIFRDLLHGLALAGMGLHASPESIAAQSNILEAGVAHRRRDTGFLRWAKRGLPLSKLLACLGWDCTLDPNFHGSDPAKPKTSSIKR